MSLSDEALLEHLNKHPALRSRVESMLLFVADEMGELQEADAAEMQLIEQMCVFRPTVALDWSDRLIGRTKPRQASCQAAAHQNRDPGIHVPGRAAHPQRSLAKTALFTALPWLHRL